jgi:putative heme iron utilization protein
MRRSPNKSALPQIKEELPMPITRELVSTVRSRLAAEPGLSTARLAEELRVSEVEVITALPRAMRLRAGKGSFGAIWEIVRGWRNASVALEDAPRVDLPRAAASGMLPVMAELEETIASIWFVSRALERGGVDHAIRFFDRAGGHIVSVHVGADARGEPDEEAKTGYAALRESFGIIPVPPLRCAGCVKCSCKEAAAG